MKEGIEMKKTINLFKTGNTEGIFQFESPGMIKFFGIPGINTC